MLQTLGVVVLVLIALWLIFAVVGVLTAIIKSVFVVLIVIAICYGFYHYFKKH
jgi:fumarate reductase subunit D